MPPSQLVDDVRACLKQLDRLPDARERCLLVATIARTDGTGRDVVDELEAARAVFRAGEQLGDVGEPYARLLRAVDAILNPVPPQTDRAPRPRGPLVEERRYRADTDG